MRSTSIVAALAAFSICAVSSAAPPAPRYRVSRIADPPTTASSCLPGYARRSTVVGINDLGVVAGNFRCYTAADTTADLYTNAYQPFFAAAHFGTYELPMPADNVTGTIQNINNLMQAFGAYSATAGGFFGLRWNLASGSERVFSNLDCDFVNDLNYAAAGNARGYVVGWIFQKDASLPPPLDTFCLTLGWAIRSPSGVQTLGPLYGTPSDINAFDVAVGTAGTAGIKLHAPSGRVTVLDAGDATRAVIPTDINDLGEIVGYSDIPPPSGSNASCGPSTGLRWERDGRERALNKLPGALSARVWSVGYDGEAVGESGPGDYCEPAIDIEDERAVYWKGLQAINLNALIPASERITLVYAAEVNRRGQIAATGYRNDEAALACPDYHIDPETGNYLLDPALTCRNLYTFVLTPAGR